jgi:fructokinase
MADLSPTARRIVVVGEILWDVFPAGERLGGAPFNFAAHSRRLGADVLFLSAVGDDARGRRALAGARRLGLETDWIQTVQRPTGIVSVEVDPQGQPSYVIHRPAAYDDLRLSDAQLDEIRSFDANWLYFGTLHQTAPEIRDLVGRLRDALPQARHFYDVNLRRDSYSTELVLDLLAAADVVKLNEDEAAEICRMKGSAMADLESFCRSWASELGWDAVCVTRGAAGSALLIGERFVEVEGYQAEVRDTVGAGDAFSAALVSRLDRGADPLQVSDFANRVGALVASRSGATPEWTVDDLAPSRLG